MTVATVYAGFNTYLCWCLQVITYVCLSCDALCKVSWSSMSRMWDEWIKLVWNVKSTQMNDLIILATCDCTVNRICISSVTIYKYVVIHPVLLGFSIFVKTVKKATTFDSRNAISIKQIKALKETLEEGKTKVDPLDSLSVKHIIL